MPVNQPQKFSDRLYELIQSLNHNASSMAQAIGYDRPDTVINAMKGRNLPNIKLLLAIADAYKEVNLHWLLTGHGKAFLEMGEEPTRNYSKQEDVLENANGVNEPAEEYSTNYKLAYEECKHSQEVLERLNKFYESRMERMEQELAELKRG